MPGPQSAVAKRVWRALAGIDGFAEGLSIFGDDTDPAYFVNGTQVAELDGDAVGLRLTRKVISAHWARLKTDERVERRRPGSDWLVVHLARPADVGFVLELAGLAAAAHLPPPGTSLKPPPTGGDLARRRRFH